MPRPARRDQPPRVVAVPVNLALAFDAVRGWHYVDAPPDWWLADREDELLQDVLAEAG